MAPVRRMDGGRRGGRSDGGRGELPRFFSAARPAMPRPGGAVVPCLQSVNAHSLYQRSPPRRSWSAPSPRQPRHRRRAGAMQRLQPHAGRCLLLTLQGWPTLLPAMPPLAIRITPAGLTLEWCGEAVPEAPELRVSVDASTPRWPSQALGGENRASRLPATRSWPPTSTGCSTTCAGISRTTWRAPDRRRPGARTGEVRRRRRRQPARGGARHRLVGLAPARRQAAAGPARDEAHRPPRLHLRHGGPPRAGRGRWR